MQKSSTKSKGRKVFTWTVENGLAKNATRLGTALAKANPHLYRTDQGLIEAVAGQRKVRSIDNAGGLRPLFIDCLHIQVVREGKIVGELPQERHLNTLLVAEQFLRHFKPVDTVTFLPVYLPDFTLAPLGYHDGGPGQRILYLGPKVEIANSMEAWERFLSVMHCDSEASRTNILGAALTVLLRHHFPGHKPLILVTATQSHAGKGTVVQAISGRVARASIQYQTIDWPMELSLHRQLAANPDIGVIDLDNVRKDSGGGGNTIRSALFESLVTSSEVRLNSATVRSSFSRRNEFVVALNTNEGTVSLDLLNRSLWIHLAPKGDIHQRKSPIGDPKLEYLPQHQQQMEAELHGLIARWRAAGCPLNEEAYHPMILWSRTIGGILRFDGYNGFLANYRQAAQQIDPHRRAVALLGAAKPGVPMRAAEWAQLAVDEGHASVLFSAANRGTHKGRERGMGKAFMRYLSIPLEAETETKRLRLKLERLYRRWERGHDPYVMYQFEVLEESLIEEPSLDEPAPAQGTNGQLVNLTSSLSSAKATRTRHTPTTEKPRRSSARSRPHGGRQRRTKARR